LRWHLSKVERGYTDSMVESFVQEDAFAVSELFTFEITEA
jgi:hypothetical protein